MPSHNKIRARASTENRAQNAHFDHRHPHSLSHRIARPSDPLSAITRRLLLLLLLRGSFLSRRRVKQALRPSYIFRLRICIHTYDEKHRWYTGVARQRLPDDALVWGKSWCWGEVYICIYMLALSLLSLRARAARDFYLAREWMPSGCWSERGSDVSRWRSSCKLI